jgi:hypothetical protein
MKSDFNGDGKADVLWQNSSGARAIWLMNGTTYSSSVYFGTAATSWNIRNYWSSTPGVGRLPQACRIYLLSLHASVAFPFNLLHLAGSYIDLERAIVSNMTLPVRSSLRRREKFIPYWSGSAEWARGGDSYDFADRQFHGDRFW